QLIATVKDGGYLTVKTWGRSAYALETDITAALAQAPMDASTDGSLQVLKRSIARMSHLLNQCETQSDVRRLLHRGLSPLPELSALCTLLEQELPRPFLTSWYPLPDLGLTVLLRSLQGHTAEVNGCAVSPDGRFIVSASNDR